MVSLNPASASPPEVKKTASPFVTGVAWLVLGGGCGYLFLRHLVLDSAKEIYQTGKTGIDLTKKIICHFAQGIPEGLRPLCILSKKIFKEINGGIVSLKREAKNAFIGCFKAFEEGLAPLCKLSNGIYTEGQGLTLSLYRETKNAIIGGSHSLEEASPLLLHLPKRILVEGEETLSSSLKESRNTFYEVAQTVKEIGLISKKIAVVLGTEFYSVLHQGFKETQNFIKALSHALEEIYGKELAKILLAEALEIVKTGLKENKNFARHVSVSTLEGFRALLDLGKEISSESKNLLITGFIETKKTALQSTSFFEETFKAPLNLLKTLSLETAHLFTSGTKEAANFLLSLKNALEEGSKPSVDFSEKIYEELSELTAILVKKFPQTFSHLGEGVKMPKEFVELLVLEIACLSIEAPKEAYKFDQHLVKGLLKTVKITIGYPLERLFLPLYLKAKKRHKIFKENLAESIKSTKEKVSKKVNAILNRAKEISSGSS